MSEKVQETRPLTMRAILDRIAGVEAELWAMKEGYHAQSIDWMLETLERVRTDVQILLKT